MSRRQEYWQTCAMRVKVSPCLCVRLSVCMASMCLVIPSHVAHWADVTVTSESCDRLFVNVTSEIEKRGQCSRTTRHRHSSTVAVIGRSVVFTALQISYPHIRDKVLHHPYLDLPLPPTLSTLNLTTVTHCVAIFQNM